MRTAASASSYGDHPIGERLVDVAWGALCWETVALGGPIRNCEIYWAKIGLSSKGPSRLGRRQSMVT